MFFCTSEWFLNVQIQIYSMFFFSNRVPMKFSSFTCLGTRDQLTNWNLKYIFKESRFSTTEDFPKLIHQNTYNTKVPFSGELWINITCWNFFLLLGRELGKWQVLQWFCSKLDLNCIFYHYAFPVYFRDLGVTFRNNRDAILFANLVLDVDHANGSSRANHQFVLMI